VNQAGAVASIWSYGNRNPQGLQFHPVTGKMWATEHGPAAGDELNRIDPGRNYGWPTISRGNSFAGEIIEGTERAGMEQPVIWWTPTVAPSGITFYTGDRFPAWKNDLFIATLFGRSLRRVTTDGDKVTHQEVVFAEMGRVRTVVQGPDGYLYVLLASPGRVARMVPVAAGTYDREQAEATRDPKLTEVWSPVPPKVVPGTVAGAPPSDAIVLFDGRNLDAWKGARGGDAKWTVANGELIVAPGTGDIQTKAVFGDVQLHVEWTVPDLPASNMDQDRGNSGIFLQDVYEVQVLDNFTNPTYVNGMVGSIYKQFAPLVNPARPAEQWQTYDIIWTAPRFGADGALVSPARVTVLLNGVLVQNNSVLQGATTYIGAPVYRPHGDMPIRLQDHSHLVRYRNIWLRKLQARPSPDTSK
jgi:hypothetical protein